MTLYFTADTHLGHKSIITHCHRPFATVEKMDQVLIDNINAAVGPTDTLWHLGDFCWDSRKTELYRQQIKCQHVNLIMGNHDRLQKGKYQKLFDRVETLHRIRWHKQKIVLCHYALRVWQGRHHDPPSWHLFGHSHGSLSSHGLSVDVGVDNWNYQPVSFDQVKEFMATRKPIELDHHKVRT